MPFFIKLILFISISSYIFLGFLLFSTPNLNLFSDDYSTVIHDENTELLMVFLNKKEQWHFPKTFNSIPKNIEKSVILFEDRWFYHHIGFNPISIAQAFITNFKAKKIKVGGSTITMQIARMLHPKKRNYINKFKELLFAIKLEFFFTKKELLASYLSHAPYGKNIVGYETAAFKLFNKAIHQLSWAEAALIAVIPNSPTHRSLINHPKELKKIRDTLLLKLYKTNTINHETYLSSLKETLPKKYFPFPFNIPHLGNYLKQSHNHPIIHTTINKSLQSLLVEESKKYMEHLTGSGIHNTSAIIVNRHNGEVKAYLGSHDFFSKHNGQVDGIKAPRSTASTLKPFLYALSIDRGLIHPKSILPDVPKYYGNFQAQNHNKKFSGIIEAEQALIQSLNVPFVQLLSHYGVSEFYHFLENTGLTHLFRNPNHYGLSLILGGAEASLWEITQLYYGLANFGIFSPLKIVKKENKTSLNSLLSTGSSYLTLHTLMQLKRPGMAFFWNNYEGKYPIAWKTGTSYGNRDAWAIGVHPDWVIGVWVGNFNGQGSPEITGQRIAAPLMLRIFNRLPKKTEWFQEPILALAKTLLCQDTGFALSQHCIKSQTATVPLHSPPLKKCSNHQTYTLSQLKNYALCHLCQKDTPYIKKKLLTYPPNISYYLNNIHPYPEHNPQCPKLASNQSPIEISYPPNYSKLLLPKDGDNLNTQFISKAIHNLPSKKIYWYLNNNYMGYTKEIHKRSIKPKNGKNTLKLIDQDGYSISHTFYALLEE